ncbi:MAG: peptidylprolyl isomerase, partial [Candidatus Shapirobacteria bacterium]|nr:peptidylprolyl isomerase [Candidatus Shapirobacteria bacterium]
MNLKNNFKIISLLIVSSLLLSACTNKYADQNLNMNQINTQSPTSAPTTIPNTSASSANQNNGETIVSLKTKDGEMLIKLYSKETPNTVSNFINKVNTGFYKGLIFHRVIPGFMAQGGDPTGTGTGGSKQKSELNDIPFVRGSLGLARTAETNQISNDSQFFICYTNE